MSHIHTFEQSDLTRSLANQEVFETIITISPLQAIIIFATNKDVIPIQAK
ncbi:MAG: hypothetical protein AAF327_06875 [Cyanobacteria bacterium P01_A01_bin.37]